MSASTELTKTDAHEDFDAVESSVDETDYERILRSQLAERQKTVSALKNTIAAQALEIKRLREAETALFARCAREAAAAEQIWEELERARATVAERQKDWNESKIEGHALQEKSSQLERQNNRLAEYAESLNRDKRAVRLLARQLAEEIRAGQAIHPLNDYLALTEFELAKIELQLKKTPTAAPERTRLEESLTELIAQRDFLKPIIEASRNEAEKQAAALAKIIQNEALAPTPPVPPKAPSASTT
ncbi:MAG: hypothetical protein P4M08_12725 [Oligoflexia bacterium]|nr:hypothetical protein [Oligoflexia bacterium]